MDRNRWNNVNQIFHAALELSAGDRHGFVTTASQGDADLQAEVELLLQADENAGSYIETPASVVSGALAPPLSPGEVVCERFRIVRPIAEGGMGHVFEAFDTELAVRVALKMIRPEISADPEALARFRQEVRLARRITHPNVCRTYDLEREVRVDGARGTSHELVFLTMEFLDGETLATRIRRGGAIPPGEALAIARDVADALDAARALGIVHRDMKPANIMLLPKATEDGFRAVITDFGLARLDPLISSGDSALSHTARPIGTLAYMAPEQLQGGQVSSATDVYGFGLVLFEMVTGKRAFPSDNFLSGIPQRLTGPAPDPQAAMPSLPEPWRRAIAGCLRTDPAERFASAEDAVAVLDGGQVRLPRPDRRRGIAAWPHRRAVAVLVAILVAAVAFFSGAIRLYRSRADSKVAPGALIYLTQVKNQTGEKALDNITELIRAGLAQSVQVNLLEQGRVGDILQEMTRPPDTVIDAPTAREIAMRVGAVRVVFATVNGAAGNYKLDVDIQQPDNTPARYRNHWTHSFEWHSSPAATNGAIAPELLTTVRTASDWIRHEAGESANDIARLDVPPEDATTLSWPALAQFEQGEKFTSLLKYDDAIESFQAATQIDPDFALAYARLGDVLLQIEEIPAGYRAYDRALSVASDHRLSLRERDRIKGYAALDTWNYQGAKAAFRDYLLYYPNDYSAHCYLAYGLEGLGQIEPAIASLKEAYAIDPTRPAAPEHLAFFNLLIGDVDASRQWNSIVEKTAGRDHLEYNLAFQNFLEGHYSAANDAFLAMTQSQGPMMRSVAYSYLTRLAVDEGDATRAIAWAQAGLKEDLATGDKTLQARRYLDEAAIECGQGKVPDCLEALRSALGRDNSPQLYLSASEVLGFSLAEAPASQRGRIREALYGLKKQAPAEDTSVVDQVARLHVEGEELLARGEALRALSLFQQAAAIEPATLDHGPLARAAMAAAANQRDPETAARLWREAFEACASDLTPPGARWQWAREEPPGVLTGELRMFLQLAARLGIEGSSVSQARETYSHLRKTEPSTSSSHGEARPSKVAS